MDTKILPVIIIVSITLISSVFFIIYLLLKEKKLKSVLKSLEKNSESKLNSKKQLTFEPKSNES